MSIISPVLKIESHPFYLGPISPETNLNAPDSFPFHLGVHPKFAIPVLIMSDEIREALANAYARGSMLSTPLGESTLSNQRMFEVLDKLLSLFNGDVENISFLEIGCGTGALLNELKLRGAKVMGVEIGPQGQEASKKYGFPVIDKPLESGAVTTKFDCIYSYACIEHIVELEEFFMASRNCLKENGLYFHVVPNSEFQFDLGYLDHLVHEHVNYFTSRNGIRLFESLGFRSADACTSKAGNELFLWGYFDSSSSIVWPGEDSGFVRDETQRLIQYSENIDASTKRIISALKQMKSIGFYAGGYEYSKFMDDNKNLRYFDSDPYKHGQSWLEGLSPIETPAALKVNPVEDLIICKDHYYDQIVSYIINEVNVPSSIRIHKLGNLGL